MMERAAAVDVETSAGPVAEFSALRTEILQYNQQTNQALYFQLSSTGAIMGLALAHTAFDSLTLVIPIVSYLLCLRFLIGSQQIYEIATYIREDLSARIPGGVHWEAWLRKRPHRTGLTRASRLLTFPGTCSLALAWSFHSVFMSTTRAPLTVALWGLWILGALFAVHEVYLISYWYYRNIKQRELKGGRLIGQPTVESM